MQSNVEFCGPTDFVCTVQYNSVPVCISPKVTSESEVLLTCVHVMYYRQCRTVQSKWDLKEVMEEADQTSGSREFQTGGYAKLEATAGFKNRST